jgi:cell wall assembly regulator SMI1
LRPGSNKAEIELLERTLQIRLPDPVREFLMHHNGTPGIILANWSRTGGQIEFLPSESISRISLSMIEIAEDFERDGDFGEQIGPIQRYWWSRSWVAIAEDLNGNYIYVDLTPLDGGVVGQIVEWQRGGISTWLAESLDEFLDELCAEIDSGDLTIM